MVPQIICYRAEIWIRYCLTPEPDFEQNSGAREGERQVGRTTWPPTSRGFRSTVDAMMSSFPWITGGAASRGPQLSPSPGLALGWRETSGPRSRLLPGPAASSDSTRGWKRPVFAQLWKRSRVSAPVLALLEVGWDQGCRAAVHILPLPTPAPVTPPGAWAWGHLR